MKPSKELTKLLLSTTCRFVGEYEDEGILITQASQGKISQKEWLGISENPFSRNFYVLVIKTPEWKKNTILIPDYSYLGDEICIGLSVLFGKRFDSHGLLEQHGSFYVPWFNNVPSSCSLKLAYNDHSQRTDFNIPLNLSEFRRISPLFYKEGNPREVLLSAGRFYLQAIREYENQPEVAFLNLITCGEILSLSSFFDFPSEDLMDEQLKRDIQNIRINLPDGENVSKRITNRLYQVRAKFTRAIVSLLDEQFFSSTQAPDEFTALKMAEIEKRIKAAYDLRSLHIHLGHNLRIWLSSSIYNKEEVHLGKPMIKDKKLRKLLECSPTFAGLERIMRYCLLNFMDKNGVSIRSDN